MLEKKLLLLNNRKDENKAKRGMYNGNINLLIKEGIISFIVSSLQSLLLLFLFIRQLKSIIEEVS